MNEVVDLLREHKLRKTPGRIDVLDTFREHDFALGHKDIEQALGNKYDRVTLYRIMSNFEDCGLIHRVLDGENATKYALCHANCNDHAHHDNHLHFGCTQCGKTYCLDFEIPRVSLPANYELEELQILAKGLCAQCKSNS